MKVKKLRQEIRKHSTTAIAGAFALIIALSWNDAIKTVVNSFVIRVGIPETAYAHNVVIAIIITIICVIGIMIASRYSVEQ